MNPGVNSVLWGLWQRQHGHWTCWISVAGNGWSVPGSLKDLSTGHEEEDWSVTLASTWSCIHLSTGQVNQNMYNICIKRLKSKPGKLKRICEQSWIWKWDLLDIWEIFPWTTCPLFWPNWRTQPVFPDPRHPFLIYLFICFFFVCWVTHRHSVGCWLYNKLQLSLFGTEVGDDNEIDMSRKNICFECDLRASDIEHVRIQHPSSLDVLEAHGLFAYWLGRSFVLF